MATRRKEIKNVTEEEGKSAKVTFWTRAIENAVKNNEPWFQESRDNYSIYYNNRLNQYGFWAPYQGFGNLYSDTVVAHSMNLFYSNVETKRPLLYSKLPTLDIRRRYRDKDRISKLASEILERACNYFLDNYGYDIAFKKSVLDKLVTGRGIARTIYEPGFIEGEETDEEGNVTKVQGVDPKLKKISIEFIPYDRVLIEPAKTWEDVTWIAFKHQLSQTEMGDLIGTKKAKTLNYPDTVLTGISHGPDQNVQEEIKVLEDRITIYEIWDKVERKVILFAPDSDQGILKSTEDGYNLENFFPIPRPLGLLSNNVSIIPIPELRQYKIQYLELQEIEDRIRNLVNQAKACGLFNDKMTTTDITNLLNENDGVYSPVSFDPTGNINTLLYPKDITSIVNSITVLLAQKSQIVNDIKEITGLSDIVRGVTQASETATAQKIKGDFAISRLQLEQQEIEFYVRDTLKIMCELIAEHYTGEELAAITGLEIIDIEEVIAETQARTEQEIQQLREQNEPIIIKQVAQSNPNMTMEQVSAAVDEIIDNQAQELVQTNIQAEIERIQKELSSTYSTTTIELEQIDALLKNDKLRDFNIDIETESTIKFDADVEKAQRIELLTTLSGAIQQLAVLRQTGMLTDTAIQELIGFVIRPFKVGRNLEEALLEKQDTSAAEEQQARAREAEMKLQFEKDVMIPHRELDIKEREVDGNLAIKKVQVESNELKTEVESDTDIAVARINASKNINKQEEN